MKPKLNVRMKLLLIVIVLAGIWLTVNSGPWEPHPMFTMAGRDGLGLWHWRTIPAIRDSFDNYLFYDIRLNLAVVANVSNCNGVMSSWPKGTSSECVLFEGTECETKLGIRQNQLILISSDKTMQVVTLADGTVEKWVTRTELLSRACNEENRNLWNLLEGVKP